MWENVQIFVYQVSEFHKCLLQKVTLTIKYLFAIESNADYKIFWLQITHSIQETQNEPNAKARHYKLDSKSPS